MGADEGTQPEVDDAGCQGIAVVSRAGHPGRQRMTGDGRQAPCGPIHGIIHATASVRPVSAERTAASSTRMAHTPSAMSGASDSSPRTRRSHAASSA